MVHYFVIDYGNTGEFYTVAVEGQNRNDIELYLQGQSRNVRYLKQAERTKYKKGKDIGVGNIVYCKHCSSCPKGLSPDTRERVL